MIDFSWNLDSFKAFSQQGQRNPLYEVLALNTEVNFGPSLVSSPNKILILNLINDTCKQISMASIGVR